MEQLGLGEVESSGTTYAMTVGRSLIPAPPENGVENRARMEWTSRLGIFFFAERLRN